ncbi:MAG: hypothetical protein EXQ47_12580 [Bryobacterales bacterium]|nr:hypothetical protein [Bryobacterales bacterium]
METLTFRSKHSYGQSKAGIEIPIGLRLGTDRGVRLLAKVDTGATFCIFQRDYAEQLAIPVESGTQAVVTTATGPFEVYGHNLTLSCFDFELEAMVYFARDSNYLRNVVGRLGWLQHFRLGLIDHDATLFLSRYDE